MPNSYIIFEDWIMPLFHLCQKMSWRGLCIDQEALAALRVELKDKEAEKAAVFASLAHGVNPRSPTQVAQLLYEDLKLPVQRHRKTKKVTTDEDALKHLLKYHKDPILQTLMDYREAQKNYSDYGELRLDWDGKLRTKYSLTVTDTGRLSSRGTDFDTGRDVQNIPTWFRRVVIPSPGKVFVEVDKRQSEDRIITWLAEDEEAMHVYESGQNMHKYNASKMFGIKYEEVEEKNEPGEPYYKAKRSKHAFNYGLGAIHAADIIGCTVAEAKALKIRNEKAFPKITAWKETIHEQSRTNRLLITPLGRRRLFLGRQNEDLVRKMWAFMGQSTCVDDLNRGMLRTNERLEEHGEILAQTHDGFLLECCRDDVDKISTIIRESCEVPMTIKGRELTIPVKIKTGMNWRDVE